MKRSWFSILLIAGLLGSLGLLATLQYRWLGQISVAEKDRLQKRLQTDTDRFAEDFNNEIRNAYFNFQLDADTWKKKDWAPFNKQLDFWKNNSAYPALVTDFYVANEGGEGDVRMAYDPDTKSFVPAKFPDEIAHLFAGLTKDEGFEPVAGNIPALIIPIYQDLKKVDLKHRVGPGGPEGPAGIITAFLLSAWIKRSWRNKFFRRWQSNIFLSTTVSITGFPY
jgi:hypothetical protein